MAIATPKNPQKFTLWDGTMLEVDASDIDEIWAETFNTGVTPEGYVTVGTGRQYLKLRDGRQFELRSIIAGPI